MRVSVLRRELRAYIDKTGGREEKNVSSSLIVAMTTVGNVKTVSVSTIPALPPISKGIRARRKTRKEEKEENTKSGKETSRDLNRSRTITGPRCILGSSCNREDVIR